MKKFIISVFALAGLLIANNANAQQGFSVSVKGIPQFSLLDNKDDNNSSNYTRKTTFNASFGLGAGYNFTQNLGAGFDVLYSLQGQRYKLNGKEYNQKNDYIKVPVYFSYNTDPSKKVSFIGKLGPQVSFITSSKLDDNNGNTINGNTNDQYKTATFGAMILAGAQYNINNYLYLSAAWRFDYDFTNAEDDQNKVYASGRAKTYNMTSGLEVGLKYMFKN